MSNVLTNGGPARFIVPAGARVAVYSDGQYEVIQGVRGVNAPVSGGVIGRVNSGSFLSDVLSATLPTPVEISGGGLYSVLYSVGTDAAIAERMLDALPVPTALDVTGDITSAMIYSGILTSAAAVVTGTLPTGAVFEAASTMAVGDVVRWSIVKVGANAFTVAPAASGHTYIGATTIATATSASFVTRKTAAATFVTTRV